MKYLISLVVAVALSFALTMLSLTALSFGHLVVVAVVVALASTALLKDVARYLWLAFAVAFGAWVIESGLHMAWAGYLLAIVVGVLAAALAASLASKGTGSAKPAA